MPKPEPAPRSDGAVAIIGSPQRDSLLKPPDWRYQAACQYIADRRSGRVAMVPSDPVVQYVIRGMQGAKIALRHESQADPVYGTQRFVNRCWPELMETLYRGTTGRRTAVTSTIEVSLIKGWTHEEAREAGCPVGPVVYRLYADVFFDLTGTRTVTAWMQDNLFEPERYNESAALLRTRILAYFGDGASGMDAAVSGQLDTGEAELVKRLIGNERQKRLFDYVMKHTGLPKELYATVMETALKGMTDRDFQEHMRDRDDAGSSSLEELAQHLEEGVRAFSQQELSSPRGDGLDFVNQYTRTLTGKTDDGKESIGGAGEAPHTGD